MSLFLCACEPKDGDERPAVVCFQTYSTEMLSSVRIRSRCLDFHPSQPSVLVGGLFSGEVKVWDVSLAEGVDNVLARFAPFCAWLEAGQSQRWRVVPRFSSQLRVHVCVCVCLYVCVHVCVCTFVCVHVRVGTCCISCTCSVFILVSCALWDRMFTVRASMTTATASQ